MVVPLAKPGFSTPGEIYRFCKVEMLASAGTVTTIL